MRAAALLLPAFLVFPFASPCTAATQQKPLTVEALYAHGPLIGKLPAQLSWSPDGKYLSYLDGGQLIAIDAATGRTRILISRQKLAPLMRQPRSELAIASRARYGMGSYFWAPDGKHLMFDSNGTVWIYNLENGTGVQVAATGTGFGDDPKFSPDGTMISFIRDRSLVVMRLRERGTPVNVVAPSEKPYMLNGQVDWLYKEELDTRSNYFWAPDGKHLAFLQMDEARVPEYPIEDWLPVHAAVDLQPYPQPGDHNPSVRVGVVRSKGGRVTWVKVPFAVGDDYIPRFGWIDAKTLWVETLSRDQKHRVIYFSSADSGNSQKMLEINDDKFLDDNYDVSAGDGHIVLTDWSSGHNQLYLYSYDKRHPLSGPAQLERQLTEGDFEVGDVYNVDDEAGVVDYASNEGNPLEQQLWEVTFQGKRRQLTTSPGFHIGNFATAGGGFVDKHSTRMSPPTFYVCRETDVCHVFWKTNMLESYGLVAPRQLEVKAKDGTTLYATLLLPKGEHAVGSVPLLVNPYGGPGAQEVKNAWSNSLLFDELLAQHGIAVLHADNRGMGGRGRAFAQAAYQNFGPVQFEDQLTVLDDTLKQFPELNAKRLGWWGWSWGGTFTLYAMTHSDRFRAGVAVAPVTDWRNYDSAYTERYLGEPAEFRADYQKLSVVNSAANLKGNLLLVHGTGDDNVHFGNTVQFVQALIEAGKPYKLEIYPRETHSLLGNDVQTHLYKSILAHFERYLLPPPTGDVQ